MGIFDRCGDTITPPDFSGWAPCSALSVEIGDITLGAVTIDGTVDVNITGQTGPLDVTVTNQAPEIRTECLCDVLADGTVVPFVRAALITVDAGVVTSTALGDFSDETLATSYTPAGTVGDCTEAGDEPLLHASIEFVDRCDVVGGEIVQRFVRAYYVALTSSGPSATQIGTGWTDRSLAFAYTPVGAEDSCDDVEACKISQLRFTCGCDQMGNGTVVQFVRAFRVDILDQVPVVTQIGGEFTDETMATPYTIVGTEVDCGSIGDTVYGVEANKDDVAPGATWEAPPLAQTIAVAVRDGSGHTLTDSSGTVTTLVAGTSYNWTAVEGSHVIATPFTIQAGDTPLEITYTVLATV